MPEVYTRKTLEEIPNELAERNQFVVWRWEKRNGKSTKVPYSSSSHKRADTTDPNTWGSFRTALRTVRRNPKHYAGLGFVFSIDDQFAAIDLFVIRAKHWAGGAWAAWFTIETQRRGKDRDRTQLRMIDRL